MKKILLALTLLAVIPNAQAKDKEEIQKVLVKNDADKYVFEGVVNVDGAAADMMYKRAKEWVIANLKTGDNNIQFDDEKKSIVNSATIVIKQERSGMASFSSTLVNFKLNLQFKDGRYKFVIDNVVAGYSVYNRDIVTPYSDKMVPSWNKYNSYLIEKINNAMADVAAELDGAIKGKAASNDNW